MTMNIISTPRLGDGIHAFAVMSAVSEQRGNRVFHAYAPHASMFADNDMVIVLNRAGSCWSPAAGQSFRGPRDGEHVRLTMAKAAGFLGDSAELKLRLKLIKGDVSALNYAVICPDTAVRYKEWIDDRWARVAEELLSHEIGVVMCRAPDRPPMAMPSDVQQVEAGIADLARLSLGATMMIGTDSGHLHLADALGVPVVGLYASTSVATYGPFSDASHCVDRHQEAWSPRSGYNSARHNPKGAMRSIGVEDVLARVNGVLSQQERA